MLILLDRYIGWQFCKNLFLLLASLIAIYLLVDFFEHIDKFLKIHQSPGRIATYFLGEIPMIVDTLFPVAILLAGVITLGLLNHHREFIALQAGGIGIARITAPLLAAALCFSLANLCLAQWVLPVTLSLTNRIWNEELHQIIPQGITRKGRVFHKGREGVYSFVRANPKEYNFSNFAYSAWDREHRLTLLLTAAEASWEGGRWSFRHGQRKEYDASGDYTVRVFAADSFPLPDEPSAFFVPAYKATELSISQLLAATHHPGLVDNRTAWLTFHGRLSYIFLGLPLLLLGIPVLLLVNNRWGRNLTLAVPLSCALAFAAWGWWSTAQAMAKNDYLHPLVASWSIHLVAGLLGFCYIRRQDRKRGS